MSITFDHRPVMPTEVMSYLHGRDGQILIDATAGGGGHLSMLAEAVGSTGQVLAFDKDPRAHREDAALGVALRFPYIKLFHRPFSEIKETMKNLGIDEVDGLICDLGVSSNQLDDKERGFSLNATGPLDMRMDTSKGLSAYEWLADSREQDIADTLFRYAGERKSRAIARMIKEAWPIENSTLALARLVLSAVRQKNWSKIHPATRTFQAIRMAVNGEVDELNALLADLPGILAIGSVAVFLSFHSVEDRLIKVAFKSLAQTGNFTILTKKPLTASEQELAANRRARSAKLRAIMRVS